MKSPSTVVLAVALASACCLGTGWTSFARAGYIDNVSLGFNVWLQQGAIEGIAGAAESPPDAASYDYKGRQVTASWINQQYAYFKDKITCVDGKFYDIGKKLAQFECLYRYRNRSLWRFPSEVRSYEAFVVMREPPAVGEVRISPSEATVLQLVGKDEAIIVKHDRDPEYDVLFHVRGVNPAKQIDGTPFSSKQIDAPPFWDRLLVYAGTYQYTNVMGAKHTVQSFLVYQPITREQFVTALAGGFELVRYRIVIKKVPVPGDGPPPAKKVIVDKPEIVGQPIPAPI